MSYCHRRAPNDEDDRIRLLLAIADEIAARGIDRDECRRRWSMNGALAGQLRAADPSANLGWRKLRAIAADLGFGVELRISKPAKSHRLRPLALAA